MISYRIRLSAAPLLLFAGLVVFAGWRLVEVNRQALAVLAACQNGGGTPAAGAELSTWFKAEIARCSGDAAEGRRDWETVVAQIPERINVAHAAMPSDQELAQFAASLYPKNSEAQFWLGEIFASGGDTAGAIQAYERGLGARPSAALNWRILGDLYRGQGDWQNAVRAYDQACYFRGLGRNGCYHAGVIYYHQRLYDQAIDRLKKTVEIVPEAYTAYRLLVEALIATGRAQEAVPYLEVLVTNGDQKAAETLEELTRGEP